ncbi:MAG: hypothetical protein IIW25_07260 [Bacteroidales bacterium]|nr:hypothetical protein [Bacteroidales bacterium]
MGSDKGRGYGSFRLLAKVGATAASGSCKAPAKVGPSCSFRLLVVSCGLCVSGLRGYVSVNVLVQESHLGKQRLNCSVGTRP